MCSTCRTLQTKHNCIPRLVGIMKTDQCSPALVFKGEIISARMYYQSAHKKRKVSFRAQLFQYRDFIDKLCRGLTFLHIKKLVHVEISLDSVMVSKKLQKPRLTSTSQFQPIYFSPGL